MAAGANRGRTVVGHLRIHDLIAKTAHVPLADTLRVLIALRAVALEYDMDPEAILALPYSAEKPTPEEFRRCEAAYLWMYESHELGKFLFEIEQLV